MDFRWVLHGETTSYSHHPKSTLDGRKVDFGWTTILWEDLGSYSWSTIAGRLYYGRFYMVDFRVGLYMVEFTWSTLHGPAIVGFI